MTQPPEPIIEPMKPIKPLTLEEIEAVMIYEELTEKDSDKMTEEELQFMIGRLTSQRQYWRDEVKEYTRRQVWHDCKEIRKDKRIAKRQLWSKNHDLKMYKLVLECVKQFG